MSLIREEDKSAISDVLKAMVNPVRLVHFTQEINLQYGREARELLQDLAELCGKLSVEIYNLLLDTEKVAEYGIDKAPATVVRNGKDYGIRFYGLPAGYEFSNLLDAITAVSQGDSGLEAATREKLQAISEPVHLQVFTTPT